MRDHRLTPTMLSALWLFSRVASLWLSYLARFTFQLVRHLHILGAFLESHMDSIPPFSLSSCCFSLLGFLANNLNCSEDHCALSLSIQIRFLTVEISSETRIFSRACTKRKKRLLFLFFFPLELNCYSASDLPSPRAFLRVFESDHDSPPLDGLLAASASFVFGGGYYTIFFVGLVSFLVGINGEIFSHLMRRTAMASSYLLFFCPIGW